MNKVEKILIGEQFKFTKINGWFAATYYYMIDRNNRTKKRIDKWLHDQLQSVPLNIWLLAQSLKGKNNDITIINILKWVRKNIKYKSDKSNWNNVEYWATAEETIDRGFDDCDGMNGLIYILARLAGIGRVQLYCAIGDTSGGGHFWLLYWSTVHDKLVCIDSTYYPSNFSVKNRPKFFLNNKYQSIWYVFNSGITLKIK